MKQIGKSFGPELIAAGLSELPIVFTKEGEVTGRENLTDEENQKLQAIIDAHDPDTWDKQQDARRERLKIYTADQDTQELVRLLTNSTPGEIDAWVGQAQDVKSVLIKILKYLGSGIRA